MTTLSLKLLSLKHMDSISLCAKIYLYSDEWPDEF